MGKEGIEFFQKTWVHLTLIILLTFGVYANSFKNEFVYDDEVIIIENSFIRNWKNLPKIFTEGYFTFVQEGFYRPISTITYFIDYSLWGLNTLGWRLTSISFHIANAILIYFLVRLIFSHSLTPSLSNSLTALFTALLFALHPVHTETVNCISFRKDIISFFFFLLSFYLYLRATRSSNDPPPLVHSLLPKSSLLYLASCVFFILGLFSKEEAIILFVVLIIYEYIFIPSKRGKQFLIKHFPYWFIAGFFLFFTFFAFKPTGYILGINISQPRVYPPGGILIRLINSCKAFVFYIKLLLLPTRLTVDYEPTISYSFADTGAFLSIGLLLFILLFAIIISKYSKVITFSILYFFIAFLPVSNIVPIGAIMAERYLYFPSLGFCLLLATIFTKTEEYFQIKKRKTLPILLTFFVLSTFLFYSLRTIKRNTDWKDALTLWTKTVEVSPQSWLAHTNLGDAYAKRGMYEQAIREYSRSLEIYLYAPETYASLGKLYFEKKDFDRAIVFLNHALSRRPNYAEVHHILGELYLETKKYEEAIVEFSRAKEINPFFLKAYLKLGETYLKKGMSKEAQKEFSKILELEPKNQEAQQIYKKFY